MFAAAVIAVMLAQQPIQVYNNGQRVGTADHVVTCSGTGVQCSVPYGKLQLFTDAGTTITQMPYASFPLAASSLGRVIFDTTFGALWYSDGTYWLRSLPGNPDGGPITVAQSVSRDGGTDWAVQVNNIVTTEEVPFSVAYRGSYGGKVGMVHQVLGRRSEGWTSTSAYGDCANYLDNTKALITTPDSEINYYLLSTSTSDIDGGTGAQSVRITGLKANREVTEQFMMLGTEAVDAGNNWGFIQWMEVSEIGSNEVSVGTITLASVPTAGPTAAETVALIRAGGNRSLGGAYKVPDDYTAFVMDYGVTNIGSATMDTKLRAQVFDNDESLSPVFHFIQSAYLATAGEVYRNLHFIPIPANAVIKVSAIPSNVSSGNKLDCSFDLLLIEN